MTDPTISDDTRLTVGEIAELAGVGSSAVSNWRRRHSDFPSPVEEGSTGDVFEWRAVRRWLDRMGKTYRAAVTWEEYFWNAADRLRSQATRQVQAAIWLQLLLIRSRDEGSGHEKDLLAGAWKRLINSDRPIAAWKGMLDQVSAGDEKLARALEPNPELSDQLLRSMLESFPEFNGVTAPDWGELATDLLSRMQDSSIVSDQFYTPAELSKLLVSLIGPVDGKVYDPACGVGMSLAEAWRQRESDAVKLFGQEVNFQSWQLGYLHLELIEAQFELESGDTLRDDRFGTLKADRIIAEPPLGLRPPEQQPQGDRRWSAGIPRSSADLLWIQQAVYHLAPDGRAVVMVAPTTLSQSGREAAIRQSIIEAGIIEAVIELPPGAIPRTSISPTLLVLHPASAESDQQMLFVDAKQLGESRRGQPHLLGDSDIERIRHAVEEHRAGSTVDEPRFAATVSRSMVLERGGALLPSWYITYATPVEEIEGEPISDRLVRLVDQAATSIANAAAAIESIPEYLGAFTAAGAAPAFEQIRLGDILTEPAKAGVRQKEEGAEECPYVTTSEVGSEHALAWPSGLALVPNEVTRGGVKDRTVSRGDLLLASRGLESASRVGCAVVEFDDCAAYSESLIRLRVERSAAEPHYLRLFFTSRQGHEALIAATTGSVISNLRPSALEEIELPLPSLEYQRIVLHTIERLEADNERLTDASVVVYEAIDTIREGVVGGTLHVTS